MMVSMVSLISSVESRLRSQSAAVKFLLYVWSVAMMLSLASR